MKRNERGAIVVEATLSLSFFMFAIVTLLTIVNICYAQAKIGTALHATAKEISQYSYLYSLTGLAEVQGEMHAQGEDARQSTGNILQGVTTLTSALGDASDAVESTVTGEEDLKGSLDKIQGAVEAGKEGYGDIKTEVGNIVSDPKNYIISVAYMGANELTEKGKSMIMEPLVRVLMGKHLKGSASDNSDAFLRHLGVEQGLKGLDFKKSSYFLNGTDEIKLVATYKVKVIQLLNLDLEYTFQQCAPTRVWGKGLKKAKPPGQEQDGSSGQTEETKKEETNEKPAEQKKTAEEYAQAGTKPGKSNMVILGEIDSVSGYSYVTHAKTMEATYFYLEEWDQLEKEHSPSEMNKILEAFMKQQMSSGKEFYMTDDPNHASGAYKKQVEWLKKQGYTFEFNAGVSVWKAVKN